MQERGNREVRVEERNKRRNIKEVRATEIIK
jgi:hypothetical protein